MPGNEQKWQAARLIPVTGITGADEQERRGTSVLLAVLGSVREFGRAVTALMDAPAGKIETFVEVEFPLGDGKVRPDGLIQVRRGNRTWSRSSRSRPEGTGYRYRKSSATSMSPERTASTL